MKTRFAPSPTGYLHIGGARTALFAWLWAQQNNAQFLLRIEDTDTERSTQASVDAILEGMKWLGLDYVGKPIFQSERLGRYQSVIQQLLNDGNAYYCQCSKQRLDELRQTLTEQGKKPKYDGYCRNKNHDNQHGNCVVRFKNPLTGEVSFTDDVKGKITIANTELDDLIIARGDGSPTYNLTVVVDDYDMQISCVIRGDDHINNTPKQINLYRALGWNVPRFAHLPMILGADKKRLSKRHGAVSVMQYRDEGFLPQALLNYLVRLGWSHGDQEVFSIDEMIQHFSLQAINKAAASFNPDKLRWLNQHTIQQLSADDILPQLLFHLDALGIDTTIDTTTENPPIKRVINILQQRAKTLTEMAQQCRMFYQDILIDDTLAAKHLTADAKIILQTLRDKLSALDEWHAEAIHSQIKAVCDQHNIGFGKVGQPFRIALSGNGQSPSIDITAELIGKKRTLQRLDTALEF